MTTSESGSGKERGGAGWLEAKPRAAPLGRKLKGEREKDDAENKVGAGVMLKDEGDVDDGVEVIDGSLSEG